MKIIDKENDIYDYLIQEYGVDPLLVYVRNGFKSKIVDSVIPSSLKEILIAQNRVCHSINKTSEVFRMEYLVIGASVFSVVESITSYDGVYHMTKQRFPKLDKTEWSPWSQSRFFKTSFKDEDMVLSKLADTPVSLARVVRNDLYSERDFNKPTSIEFTPVRLKNVRNLTKEISIFDIYQNITDFLSKQKDEKPIAEVSNDVKILQAGFDLKQSFRHRK